MRKEIYNIKSEKSYDNGHTKWIPYNFVGFSEKYQKKKRGQITFTGNYKTWFEGIKN